MLAKRLDDVLEPFRSSRLGKQVNKKGIHADDDEKLDSYPDFQHVDKPERKS